MKLARPNKLPARSSTSRSMVVICANCGRIRDDRGQWHPGAAFVEDHPGAKLSHGICPVCMQLLYSEYAPTKD